MPPMPVAAPVLAQLASPAPVGKAPSRPRSQPPRPESVKAKVKAGRQVLDCAKNDPAVGTRFDALRRELGDNFIAVEFPGRKHATLTEHCQQAGVDRVLASSTRSEDAHLVRTLIARRADRDGPGYQYAAE
jgi:hypothetical protein